jgi:hypothetical protein
MTGPTERDRGQLILVAALAIATAIVALVLLLNTSIYMENLATRDTDTGASEAIAFRNTVEANLWPVVAAENDRPYTNRSKLRTNVTKRTNRLVELTASQHRRSGVAAELSNTTLDNGTRLRQTDSTRALTANDSDANWTLATGADDVRGFEFNATGDEPLGANATEIRVDESDSSETWSLFVYDNGSSPSLAVNNATGGTTANICDSQYSDGTRVNLTAGTINGTACPAIEFAKGADPPYDISYNYSDNATGTYDLTVNTTVATHSGDNFNDTVSNTTPYAVPVVYSVSTDVVYRSPELSYRANVTVTEGSS